MNAFLKISKAIVFSIMWLMIFILFTTAAARFSEPGYKKVSATDLPDNYPVAVYWKDSSGENHCRAFWVSQLDRLSKSVQEYSFNIPNHDFRNCLDATVHLKKHKQWPVMFEWEDKVRWPYATIEINKGDSLSKRYNVFYTDDDDLYNESSYQLDGDKIVDPSHKLYSGPGVAIKSIPYGLAATISLWLGVFVFRKKYLKRSAKS